MQNGSVTCVNADGTFGGGVTGIIDSASCAVSSAAGCAASSSPRGLLARDVGILVCHSALFETNGHAGGMCGSRVKSIADSASCIVQSAAGNLDSRSTAAFSLETWNVGTLHMRSLPLHHDFCDQRAG